MDEPVVEEAGSEPEKESSRTQPDLDRVKEDLARAKEDLAHAEQDLAHTEGEEPPGAEDEPETDEPEPPLHGDATPEARKPKRRFGCWILLIVLVVAGVIAFIVLRRESAAKAEAAKKTAPPPPLSISIAKAEQGDIGVYINALGSVSPLNTVTVKSRVDGQLISVNYREGEMVHAGEVLAELDPRTFQAQLTQSQGTFDRDNALLDNARIDLARYQLAYSKNAIPKQQLDTQAALVHQLEGTIRFDQGQIDSAKVQLAYCRITSPISGRVGLRLVDPGNIVHASDTNGMLVITQLQPISVLFSVAEDFLPAIQLQLRRGSRLPVDAYDRAQQNKLSSGTVLTTDNQIDTTTGTIKLKAVFANTDSQLFPNQFINAKLLVDTKRDVILIPTAAIQRNAQQAYVYVVKADQTVAMQQVTVGTTEGSVSEVSGLNAGDTVAVDGFDKLQTGTKVAPRKASDSGARDSSASNGGKGTP